VPSTEVVLIARFEVPAKSVLSRRPEHKVQYRFTAERVSCDAVVMHGEAFERTVEDAASLISILSNCSADLCRWFLKGLRDCNQ
jgi:hypothetical protein